MKSLLLKLPIALVAFVIGTAVVFLFDSATEKFLPMAEAPPEIANSHKVGAEKLIVDYQPLHWPRMKNTRLALPGYWISGDEEKPTTGYEKWIGLYKTANGYEMRVASVKISRFEEEVCRPCMPLELQVKGEEKPLFVLRGLGLKTGKADSILEAHNDDNEALHAFGVNDCGDSRVSLGSKNYLIYTESVENQRDTACNSGITVVTDGARKQILGDPDIDASFDYSRLIWAGDIDSDDKLDLILNFGHSGARWYHCNFVLFLSSEAKPNEIVAPVASFKVWR
jgi:hypothetical protein